MTTASTTRKVGDLVDLQPIQTIIQLGDLKSGQEALEAFVLTEDLRLILEDFSQRLQKNQGAGVFLKGHYGTGKSHLLSFIGEDAKNGFPTLTKHISSGTLPSFNALSISLVQHPASRSLEDILMGNIPVSDVSNREHRHDFHLNLIQRSKEKGHHGLILLFDELSEFLKAKPNPESLTEDLRYLQFLGELTNTQPLWLIGAIQEDLEGMGAATRETSLKLKDRFSLRWNLSRLHLEQMLSQRLLTFKEGAPDFLARLNQRCQALWPSAFERDGHLLAIYPLHPLTLDLLTHLGTLFSEHRGALRFVRDVLQGLESKPSHLEREAHALIGPEYLFDYFSNRFEENLELQHYHRKAWVHLNQRVQDRLPPEDRDLAFRALKVILLCSIDPRQEGIDLVRLGEALMLQRDSDAIKGRLDLKETVLDPILERCNYLKVTGDRYHIDLSHEGQSLLDELLAKRIANLPPLEEGGWLRLLSLLDQNPLRLAPLLRQISPVLDVQWLNSVRKLQISFGEESTGADLLLLLPGQVAEPNDQNTLIWEPLAPEDPNFWREALALIEIVEAPADTAMEARAKEQALKRYRTERPRWQEKLEDLYVGGRQLVGRQPLQLQLDLARRLSIEAFLEPLVHEVFSRRHPLYRTIAPKISYYSEQSYAQLVEHLFRPGSIKDAEAGKLHLGDALHGLALPMGLAEKKGSLFLALWDSARNELLKAFEETLVTNDLPQSREKIKAGPWGIPEGQLNFLIWAGVAMGHFIAFRDGDELPFEKLSLYNLESIDALQKREALDDSALHQLSNQPFFNHPGLDYSGLTLQRKLWERAVQQVEATRTWLDEKQILGEEFWSTQASLMEHHRECLNKLSQMIKEQGNNSHAGLDWCHTHLDLLNSWLEASRWFKDFRRLDRNHGKELDQTLIFMLDEALSDLGEESSLGALKKERLDLLQHWRQESDHPSTFPLESVETWLKESDAWCQTYRQAYRASHLREQEKLPKELYDWLSRLQLKGIVIPSLPLLCERPLARELQYKTECRCGHRIGTSKHKDPDFWAEKFIEGLRPLFRDHQSFPILTKLCKNKSFSEADRLWQDMEKDVAPQKDKPIKDVSLNHLIGKAQVMNLESIIEEIRRNLPEDPDQLYRIED